MSRTVDRLPGVLSSAHIGRMRDQCSGGMSLSRICFHDDDEANLHVMLISIPSDQSYPVHCHDDFDEWYFILSGSLVVTTYQPDGVPARSTQLASGEFGVSQELGILMPRGVWHSTSAGSSGAVFLEVRPGPFRKNNTRFFK